MNINTDDIENINLQDSESGDNSDFGNDPSISSSYLNEWLESAYLDYSMTVIVNRAIPNFFDGCKPVQRRIIYAMAEAGCYNSSPYKKCVSVVGNVLAKYHPHGQSAVYEALVRMAQPFSLNVPLIDGQGNFGSIDGDPPAADRYTECRLAKIAKHLVEDCDKDTVLMVDNFDASTKMPTVLPAAFPNLLVNGAYGIAVGMSTSIPPHNLGEVIGATCAMMDNPDISLEEILEEHLKGPDFPTGGLISTENIFEIYSTGRGSFICMGVAKVEDMSVVITEIPYQLNKSRLVEEIVELAKNEEMPEISEVSDQSSLEGIRIVVELKRGSDPDLILRKLFARTSLQTNINVHMLALQDKKPRQFSLLELLRSFIDEREKIIINRTKFFLKNAKSRAHILWGHALAVSKLDEVIETIKKSSNKAEAVKNLQNLTWCKSEISTYMEILEEQYDNEIVRLSEAQIKAILEMRLQSLTTLEQTNITEELQELGKKIKDFKKILDNREERYRLMKVEMSNINKNFAQERQTKTLEGSYAGIESLALVKQEDIVVTLTENGILKGEALDSYRTQKRGGKGRNSERSGQIDENDPVKHMLVANTHDDMIVFTNKGTAYLCPVRKVPQKKASAIANFLPSLEKEEKVAAILPVTRDDREAALVGESEKCMLFVTSSGHVRRNSITDFCKIKSNGKKAMPLEEGETLAEVMLTEKSDEVFIMSSNGKAVRFNIDSEVRIFKGRDSKGVRGMVVPKGSKVVSVTIIKPGEVDQNIITLSEKGFGKVSRISDFRLTSRATKGVTAAVVDNKTGPLIGAYQVSEGDQVLLMGSTGQTIRCNISSVRVVGRSSKGVHMMSLKSDEYVRNAFIIKDENSDDARGLANPEESSNCE